MAILTDTALRREDIGVTANLTARKRNDYSVLPPARNTRLLTTFLAAVLQEAAITIAKIRKYVRGFRFEKKAKCAIDMNLRGVVGQAVSPGVCKARS